MSNTKVFYLHSAVSCALTYIGSLLLHQFSHLNLWEPLGLSNVYNRCEHCFTQTSQITATVYTFFSLFSGLCYTTHMQCLLYVGQSTPICIYACVRVSSASAVCLHFKFLAHTLWQVLWETFCWITSLWEDLQSSVLIWSQALWKGWLTEFHFSFQNGQTTTPLHGH